MKSRAQNRCGIEPPKTKTLQSQITTASRTVWPLFPAPCRVTARYLSQVVPYLIVDVGRFLDRFCPQWGLSSTCLFPEQHSRAVSPRRGTCYIFPARALHAPYLTWSSVLVCRFPRRYLQFPGRPCAQGHIAAVQDRSFRSDPPHKCQSRRGSECANDHHQRAAENVPDAEPLAMELVEKEPKPDHGPAAEFRPP